MANVERNARMSRIAAGPSAGPHSRITIPKTITPHRNPA